ncbi:type I pantothenate kinase, partial [Rhizobium ruizarguesonis]
WYVTRFRRLRETAVRDPDSYFQRYASISDAEALEIAEDLGANINLKNLRQNRRPTRPRADLILKKGKDHLIE